VDKANASVAIALTAGTNPSLSGDSLTFTASVTPGSATGTVTFLDGGTALSAAIPLSSGSTSFTTSTLAAGSHSITAQYSGDATFNATVSASLSQTVSNPKANSATTIVLSAGANPSVFGTTLTFTASVAPASATGTVIFFDGGVPITGSIPLSSGSASFSISTLEAGTHSVVAQYSGDANTNGSVSTAFSQTISKARTTVELEVGDSDTDVKPGKPVTFLATITPSNASGNVLFFDGSTQISGSVSVNNGTASFTVPSLSVGTHSITTRYNGDANFNGSTSAAHKITVK